MNAVCFGCPFDNIDFASLRLVHNTLFVDIDSENMHSNTQNVEDTDNCFPGDIAEAEMADFYYRKNA